MSRQVAPLLYSSGLITQGPGCEPGIKVYYINQYLWGLRYFAACFPRARAEFVFYNFFFGFCATRLGLLFILFLDILWMITCINKPKLTRSWRGTPHGAGARVSAGEKFTISLGMCQQNRVVMMGFWPPWHDVRGGWWSVCHRWRPSSSWWFGLSCSTNWRVDGCWPGRSTGCP